MVFNLVFPPKKSAVIMEGIALSVLTAAVAGYAIAVIIDDVYSNVVDPSDVTLKNNLLADVHDIWNNAPQEIVQTMIAAVAQQVIVNGLTSEDVAQFEVPVSMSNWVLQNYTLNNAAYDALLDSDMLTGVSEENLPYTQLVSYADSIDYDQVSVQYSDLSSDGWIERTLNVYLNKVAVSEFSPAMVYYSEVLGEYVVDTSTGIQLYCYTYYDYDTETTVLKNGIQFYQEQTEEYIAVATNYDWSANIIDSGGYANNYSKVLYQSFQQALSGANDLTFTLRNKANVIAEQKNQLLTQTAIPDRLDVSRSIAIPLNKITVGTLPNSGAITWSSANEAVLSGLISTTDQAPAGVFINENGQVVTLDSVNAVSLAVPTTTTIHGDTTEEDDNGEALGWWQDIPSLEDLKNMIIGWLSGLLGLLVAPLNWIGDAIAALADNIYTGINNVVDSMQNLWEDAGAIWSGIADNLANLADSIASKLAGFFSDILTGIESGVKLMVDTVVGWIDKVITGIKQLADYLNPWSDRFALRLAFVPAVGYFDTYYGDLSLALTTKFSFFAQLKETVAALKSQQDNDEWPGLFANFSYFGIGVQKVVDNKAANEYAHKIKYWIGGLLYFMTILFFIKKVSTVLGAGK